MANATGEAADALHYSAALARYKAAWHEAYYSPPGAAAGCTMDDGLQVGLLS